MSIIETSDGYTISCKILDEMTFKIIEIKDDETTPKHIEGGFYFIDRRNIIVGQQGTIDPPEPFSCLEDAWNDARDFCE